MIVALLFPVFGAILTALRIRPFAGTAVIFLLVPLIAVPLSPFLGISLATALSLILSVVFLSRPQFRVKDQERFDGLAELSLVPIVFFPLRTLISRWPEFYNLGEHIRDFAVLSAVIREPVRPMDPWCDSLVLNYYIYWYRYAAVLSHDFSLSTAQVNHLLIALTPALLFATLTRLGRIVGKWGWFGAFVSATLITFGSNIAGVLSIVDEAFWWGPSRAISIGITEFPAWSYLLGDLHPHYLSIVLLPIYLLIACEMKLYVEGRFFRAALLGLYLCACFSISAAANTWDLVGFGILSVPLILIGVFSKWEKAEGSQALSLFDLFFIAVFLLTITALALLSNAHMQPAPVSLKWIHEGIPRTKLSEYLSHWGFALVLIVLAFIFLRQKVLENKIAFAITLGSLLVLLFTELFFFDDAYTGEFERLNTIFKLSSFVWVPLHFGAFLLFAAGLKRLPEVFSDRLLQASIASAVTVVFTAFFLHTALSDSGRAVLLPRYVQPRDEGLSKIEVTFPGAAKSIELLRQLPPGGRIAEWNEPGYSDAANICSLSEHDCYAGWRNHLSIQYEHGLEELSRREQILRELYSEGSCEEIRKIALAENISAIVVGPTEKKAFPQTPRRLCFRQIVHESALTLYLP